MLALAERGAITNGSSRQTVRTQESPGAIRWWGKRGLTWKDPRMGGQADTIAGRLFWFLYDRATGRHVAKELARLEREQYLPLPELDALRLERLRALLTHAASHVPYYRELFRTIGFSPADVHSLDDLARLPVLERETVRDHSDRLLDERLARKRLHMTMTSGTTGLPIRIYHDDAAINVGVARYWRACLARGYRPLDKVFRLVGWPLEGRSWRKGLRDGVQATFMRDWRWYHLFRRPDELARIARAIRHWRPRFLQGYLGVLRLLADYLHHRGERLDVPCVGSGGQLMTDDDRTRLREYLGREVFDCYSTDETLGLAFECEAHQGLHVHSESFILEAIVDGRPARPGELGEVFVTILTNDAMPLIRYRVGDTIAPVDKPCACGRTLPLVRMTHGRVLDLIRTADGRIITPGVFYRVFHGVGESKVGQFQVTQEALDRLRIRLVRTADYSAATEGALVSALRDEMGESVDLEFEYVEHIPLSPRGKLRVVQSEVAMRFDGETGKGSGEGIPQ